MALIFSAGLKYFNRYIYLTSNEGRAILRLREGCAASADTEPCTSLFVTPTDQDEAEEEGGVWARRPRLQPEETFPRRASGSL